MKVTEEHVRAGEIKNGAMCPIALALKEVLEDREEYTGAVYISPAYAAADSSDGWQSADLPEHASEFVRKFDKGWLPDPFTFVLDLKTEEERGRRQ